MLDRMHEVDPNLLESLSRSCPDTLVMESIAFSKLAHLQLGRVLPFFIAMQLVEPDAIFIIPRNLDAMHAFLACLAGSQFGLIHHAQHLLGSLGEAAETFPSICVQQSMVLRAYCTCHRIIGCNRMQWFVTDLPILPFDLDIVLISFP